jgi:hypothetical protein
MAVARLSIGLHFLAVGGIDRVVVQEVMCFGVVVEAGEALVDIPGKGLRDEGDVSALVAAVSVVARQALAKIL